MQTHKHGAVSDLIACSFVQSRRVIPLKCIKTYSPAWLLLAVLIISGIPAPTMLFSHALGYSYSRFYGPVSGPEQKVFVHDALNGGHSIDYIAKPEYEFAYGVEDAQNYLLQNRKETRNGDEVKGVYSVVDPDGTLRVVKYTADNVNGFQASVTKDGGSPIIHGYNTGSQDNGNIYVKHDEQQPSYDEEYVNENGGFDYNEDATENNQEAKKDYEVHEDQTENNIESDAVTNDDNNDANEDDDNDGGNDEDEENTENNEKHEKKEKGDDYDSDEESYEDAEKEAASYEESNSDEYY
ncbi:protein PFC0760c-like [Teleopsis dalmanni]|uniref:protein PFC0760c-like n=1 Tax=Teleopsis dalmanni TaxID=139649 RepID=UPI0018CDDE5C|nr:protein PFC0760c-like [Teleopsis dalmanni]